MLIKKDLIKETPDYQEWCKKVAETLFNQQSEHIGEPAKTLNQQQLEVLRSLCLNDYNIIKGFRRCGCTTLFNLKMAYDIIYYPRNILFVGPTKQNITSAKDGLLKILDLVDEPVLYEDSNFNSLKFSTDRGECTVTFLSTSSSPDRISDMEYHDVYFDDMAFTNSGFDENPYVTTAKCIHIASTPNKTDGWFYDLFIKTLDGKTLFNPMSLKWYLDDRFNTNLMVENGDEMRGPITSKGLLMEYLEKGWTPTNEYVHHMKELIPDSYESSWLGKFKCFVPNTYFKEV